MALVLTTRIAGRGDAAAVAALWTAASAGRTTDVGLPPGPAADAERQVQIRLADPGSFAALAEDDGTLVAAAIVLQALSQDGAGRDPVAGLAHVSMVAVHPERWGQGLGRLVMELAQREAGERGFTRAQLWTHETNQRAQRLYERLGWTASGRTKLDDQGEPIRHYVRDL